MQIFGTAHICDIHEVQALQTFFLKLHKKRIGSAEE